MGQLIMPGSSQITLFETQWKNSQLPPIGVRQWLETFEPDRVNTRLHRYDQELHVIQAARAGARSCNASRVSVETAIHSALCS